MDVRTRGFCLFRLRREIIPRFCMITEYVDQVERGESNGVEKRDKCRSLCWVGNRGCDLLLSGETSFGEKGGPLHCKRKDPWCYCQLHFPPCPWQILNHALTNPVVNANIFPAYIYLPNSGTESINAVFFPHSPRLPSNISKIWITMTVSRFSVCLIL